MLYKMRKLSVKNQTYLNVEKGKIRNFSRVRDFKGYVWKLSSSPAALLYRITIRTYQTFFHPSIAILYFLWITSSSSINWSSSYFILKISFNFCKQVAADFLVLDLLIIVWARDGWVLSVYRGFSFPSVFILARDDKAYSVVNIKIR